MPALIINPETVHFGKSKISSFKPLKEGFLAYKKLRGDIKLTGLEFYGEGNFRRYNDRLKFIEELDSIDFSPKVKPLLDSPSKIFTSLKDWAQNPLNKFKYNSLFLDFCDPYGNKVSQQLQNLPKIMQSEGIMYITLMMSREAYLPKPCPPGLISAIISGWLSNELTNNLRIKYKPIFSYSYQSDIENQDRKKMAPTKMYILGFTWKKMKSSTPRNPNDVRRLINNIDVPRGKGIKNKPQKVVLP